MEPLLCNVKQVCESLGISRAKLYQLWASESGPKITRVGSRVMVKREDLETWVKDLTSS
jgi:excisionase family DNA binding protein